MIKNNYSLVIPSWYPTEESPHNGIFIQKHVQLISEFKTVHVLYAAARKKQTSRFVVEESIMDNFSETMVYFKPSGNKVFNQLLQLLALWKGFISVNRIKGIPDTIHNHVVYPAGYFSLIIHYLYNIPLLVTEHWTGYSDEDGRYERLPLWQRLLIKKCFRRSDGISAISTYLKNTLLRLHLIDDKTQRIVITPNVLELPTNKAVRKSDDTSALRALCIATLNDHQKNISGLINAVAIVAKTEPTFALTIVGDGPERKTFETLADKLQLLDKNIFFTGSVPNSRIVEYYKSHDFFILNSNYETFSIATAEAILNGLPVIVTQCGGPEEFVDDSNGIVTEPGNSEKLAEAIRTLKSNIRKYDAETISTTIANRFRHETIIKSLKHLYNVHP